MGSASFKVPYRPGWACRSAEGQVGCLACGPRVSVVTAQLCRGDKKAAADRT